MVEDILEAEAADLQRQLADHDAVTFNQRLARRIAEAVESSSTERTTRIQPAMRGDRERRAPMPTRPVPRRGLRRRPTPIVAPEPAMAPSALVDELLRLCETVLRSNDIERLADFAADYDDAGARTFACLLYSLNKRESALYWWRFAAGAGDELAAHLLAIHHAAVGYSPDARLWRTIARMMGFTPRRHLPQPVRGATELAQGFARTVTRDSALDRFLYLSYLPKELVR